MALLASFFYPITLFLVVKYFGLHLDDIFVLKVLPLLLAIYVTFLMFISQSKKNSFIIKFAQKFSKEALSEEEIEYIKDATFFWIIVSLINVALHLLALLSTNEYFWVTYTSIGWYFVFGIAGVLQYLHRKFFFLKRVKNV
mgnify:CR=1 FL=1